MLEDLGKLVIDAQKNAEISKVILKYRSIVNEELVQIMFELQDEEYEKALVTGRVKAQNSIEYKIDSYVLHHEEGQFLFSRGTASLGEKR